MAPAKKPRTMSRRFSSLIEVSPEKDRVNSIKNKQRKKKMSDKLGSQWNKEELERFYEAYRKHGKDWKKVAAAIRNRSVEMVEALYNMNRAYLSLPEGTASVVGLIAMMTDHYNVLEESDSESESIDSPGSQKSVKRKCGKFEIGVSKNLVQSQSIASNDGCLSLLKRRHFDGSQPRTVGKRTPRVPVYYKKDDRDDYVSPNKRLLKSAFNGDDDEGAHVAALALTEAAKKGGSPQVSQTPYKRPELEFSLIRSRERMHQHSETVPSKFYDASLSGDCIEGSLESKGAENGEHARYTSSMMDDMEGSGTIEAHQKGNKVYRKREKTENVGNHLLDDGGEACSGTEGHNFGLNGKVDIEVTNAKPQRKRSKKLYFGVDESSSLNPLQTLADLSLMTPESTLESESSVQLKEERMSAGKDEKSAVPEATSTCQNRDKIKSPGLKQKVVQSVAGAEVSTSTKSKLGRETVNDNNTNAFFKSKDKLPSTDKTLKRKHESVGSKAVGEEKRTVIKEVQPVSEASLSTKRRSRRKMSLARAFMSTEKSFENKLKNQSNKYSTSFQDSALFLKKKLSSCLSSCMVQRWCAFEWFYSAIDYPWFSKREFMEYLIHVGLENIPRLTRAEWSVIKSSLGNPRRFSEHFLCEERQKLEQYRESARKQYTELRTGVSDGLPTYLAKPLYVGQRVIAVHPKTREIHDGSVLTVDHEKCRVQFDLPDLGVEFVMDIDCMPLNSLDNMPDAMRRQICAGKVSYMSKEPQMNVNSCFGGCLTCISADKAPIGLSALANQGKDKLLMELENANNDLSENQNDTDGFKDLEAFTKHYATVSNALLHLRQINTYTGNTLLPWMKPQAIITSYDVLSSALDSSPAQELGSIVVEIIEGSKHKAHAMVDAAFQALASMKEGEDAFMRIGQVLDSIDYQQLATNSWLPAARSQEQVNGSVDHHSWSIISSSAPLQNDASGPKSQHDSDKVGTQIPSKLITSCVATLIMIQTCTERQYPPADVAQILDYVVSSLHPYCQRNLPIYREIEMCMGRIKTQILALIPT